MCCFDGTCPRCCERREAQEQRRNEEALAALRARLMDPVATAIFTRTDGQTVEIDDVKVDTIGPVGANVGVIAVETNDDREIVHVPFVSHWTITYR